MDVKAKGRQGVRTDTDIVEVIGEKRRFGWNAAQIWKYLDAQEQFRGRVPGLRAVQAIVKRVAPPDDGDMWSILEADAEEARLILPVLGYWRVLGPEIPKLSKREAAWVAKLVTISGGRIDPAIVLMVADAFLAAEAGIYPKGGGIGGFEDLLVLFAAHDWDHKRVWIQHGMEARGKTNTDLMPNGIPLELLARGAGLTAGGIEARRVRQRDDGSFEATYVTHGATVKVVAPTRGEAESALDATMKDLADGVRPEDLNGGNFTIIRTERTKEGRTDDG